MLDWQSMLANTAQMGNDTACKIARQFYDSIEYPADVDKVKLEGVVNRTVAWACQFDPEQFVRELNSKTDFGALVNQVSFELFFEFHIDNFCIIFRIMSTNRPPKLWKIARP